MNKEGNGGRHDRGGLDGGGELFDSPKTGWVILFIDLIADFDGSTPVQRLPGSNR